MKILLINPPRLNEIIGNNPSIIEEERGFNPPLGLLYIAAYIKKFTDYQIAIIDSQVEKLSYNDLYKKIIIENPDVVGITAMTMTLVDVLKTTQLVKQINSQIKTVLGGPHVNLFPNESIGFDSVDYLVLGEGEETFTDLINAIETNSVNDQIPGIVFTKDGVIVNTNPRPLIKDLDKLPFPDRELLPYKKYNSILFKGKTVTTIFTSRGCPFNCSFCDRPHLGKFFRARSAKNVVDEIETCVRIGINNFLFYDDTFTVEKKRVIDICQLIVDRGLKISWDIRARVDTVDEEIISCLKKAGCQGIHYGIEAGTEKILKVLNKGITLDQARNTFKLTKKYRIPILSYFMIGNPEENLDDIFKTFKVMKGLKPDFIHLTILTPFPGTKIYFDGLANGIIKKDYWKEFACNPTTDFVSPHWADVFSKNELNDLLVQGYRKFYLNPFYILKSIKNIHSLRNFKKKASAGLKLINMK